MCTDLFPIDVPIGQCHGRIVLVHGLSREATNQVRLRAVRERKRMGELIEWPGTHRTLTAELFRLVALTATERECHFYKVTERE